ncbi:hypothetical protein FOZ63_024250, partial [Perkinsus olseni]
GLPEANALPDGELKEVWRQPTVRGLSARMASVPLTFSQVLPFDTTPDTASLMGDKAIALNIDDIYHIYDARVTGYSPSGRPRTDRRQLMQLLAEKDLDAGAAAQDFAEAKVDPASLIFMLKTKERQPNPVEEREFGYTTIRNRLALSTAERNVQHSLFDYVPEIMLGKTATAVDQDLERRDSPDRCLSFNVNLDYKKWCQEKTGWNTRGTTEFLDDIFGTGIYGAIHSFYGSVVYVSADPSLPPPELVFTADEEGLPQYAKDELARSKIQKWLSAKAEEARRHWAGDQSPLSFMSDKRGVEGQCQKVWTVDTFADVSLAAHRCGFNARIRGSGDNVTAQVLVRLPDYIPIGEEQGPLARQVVSEAAQRFMTELIHISGVMGKPLKPMETWLDDELYLFGKQWVLRDTILPQVLKKVSKVNDESALSIQGLDEEVGLVNSGCYDALKCAQDPVPALMVRALRTGPLLMQELHENSVTGSSRPRRKLRRLLPGVPKDDRLRAYIGSFMMLGSSLGFPPLTSLPACLYYRRHPDQAACSLSAVRCMASGGYKPASKIYRALDQRLVSPVPLSSPEPLITNPIRVPLVPTASVSGLLRNDVSAALKEIPIRNESYAELIRVDNRAASNALCAALTGMQPHLNPKYASLIYSRSVCATLDRVTSKFFTTSTLRRVGGVLKDSVTRACDGVDANLSARCAFISDCWKAPTNSTSPLGCSTNLIRDLRNQLLPGVAVDGVTCPCSVEQVAISTVMPDQPLPTGAPCMVISSTLAGQDPNARAAETRGPYEGYYGSSTKRKMVQGDVRASDLSRPQANCVNLTMESKSMTEPGSNLAGLVDQVFRSRAAVGIVFSHQW